MTPSVMSVSQKSCLPARSHVCQPETMSTSQTLETKINLEMSSQHESQMPGLIRVWICPSYRSVVHAFLQSTLHCHTAASEYH